MAPYSTLLPLMGLVLGSAHALETYSTTSFATYVKEASATSLASYSAPTLGVGDSWNCAYGYVEPETVCNVKGSLEKNVQFIESLPITFDECVTTCKFNRGCNFFYYEDNLCQTFGGGIENAGFNKGDSKGSWYQSGCFVCVKPEEQPLRLDFEDGNIDNWLLERPNDDAFFMDAIRVKAPYDGFTTALRVLEAQDSGTAYLQYPNIQLSAGAYRLGFVAKNTVQRTPSTGTQWGNVNIEVTSVDGDLYDGPVKNGVAIEPFIYASWFSWHLDFVAPVDTVAGITISITQTGLMLDWMFDDMYLIKLHN